LQTKIGREHFCQRREDAEGLTPVKFLTDWMPQPEHGGFYQALAKGYYRDVGLDVKLFPAGRVHALSRSWSSDRRDRDDAER